MSDLPPAVRSQFRGIAWFAKSLILLQWWAVPAMPADFTQKWLWALDPSRWFPVWWRVLFPLFLILFPWEWVVKSVRNKLLIPPPPIFTVSILTACAGCVFWFLRVGTLELGDAKLLLDHFLSLTTYASVREPLESILHTEFARILFFNFGVHPQTSFQIQSCLFGVATIGLSAWAISSCKLESVSPSILLVGFLVGPIHLFFGYIEWYTQLAAGLILYQVFAIRAVLTGRGLGLALGALIFAVCSHLVGLAFIPSALVLIACTRKRGETLRTILAFTAGLLVSLGTTFFILSRRILFETSLENTQRLFQFLLPMMREDNPNNVEGSWTYAWLSANHLGDLANELLLCGLFPILVFIAARRGREEKDTFDAPEHRKEFVYFFWAQLIPCTVFLLVWNPWLGFPTDWDLFSFFSWPLLAASLMYCFGTANPKRGGQLLFQSAIPTFSVVFAWVVAHHRGELPNFREVLVRKDKAYYDQLLQVARSDTEDRKWKSAFEKAERVLTESPERAAEAFALFDYPTIQKVSQGWGELDQMTPLAVDFEIVSASPNARVLALDVWGRVYFWEGGYFNDWCPMGLSGVPDEKAVDMEIAPWIPAGVILNNYGDLYQFPIPSWVDPNPPPDKPRLTHTVEPSDKRYPLIMGNFYEDFADAELGLGQSAVDLVVDTENQRFIVLDTAGNLQVESSVPGYHVDPLAALIRIDGELVPRTPGCYTLDHFARIQLWPGRDSPMKAPHDFTWPAATDLEVGFGGKDLYMLEGQGGVVALSEFGNPQIRVENLQHFETTGEPAKVTPYLTEPELYFIDLELVPGEKAYYRMTKDFRIHYSEERKPSE